MRDDLGAFSSLAFSLLSNEQASVPVRVARLERPVLCWSADVGLTDAEVSKVAVRIAEGGTDYAWADRYGGHGIGGNGGSGRAGLYSGVYLKGIGPTPLIGRTADRFHSSGGAYLEEAVRETIFGEIFDAELPWRAIRTKAIIDTLEDQIWDPDPNSNSPVPLERRVLIVRDALLRPAHLLRANHFAGEEDLVGARDVQRTLHNLQAVIENVGSARLEASLRTFWYRWADQCAYLYVNRLTQGPPTPSNIDLEGRLMDFGAASSLPDWCAAVVVPGEPENGYELPRLAAYIENFYAEHREPVLTNGDSWFDYASALAAECTARYYRTLGVEILRLSGLRRKTIDAAITDPNRCDRLARAAAAACKRYLRRFRPTIDSDPASELWDFPSFWDDDAPYHLRPLRMVADEVAGRARGEPVRERMQARCRSRERLFRETFRRRLHESLPALKPGEPIDRGAVADIIQKEVTMARRDTCFEPRSDYLCGFAGAGSKRFALFRDPDGKAYAVEECRHGDRGQRASARRTRRAFSDGRIGDEPMEVVHLL